MNEFPLILECKVIHIHAIGLHTQFIGEIIDTKADEDILNAKGLPRMDAVAPFVFGHGSRKYWALGDIIGKGFEMGKKFMAAAS